MASPGNQHCASSIGTLSFHVMGMTSPTKPEVQSVSQRRQRMTEPRPTRDEVKGVILYAVHTCEFEYSGASYILNARKFLCWLIGVLLRFVLDLIKNNPSGLPARLFERCLKAPLMVIHTATPDTTKLSCLCRVLFGGVNWIPDNSRLSPAENLKYDTFGAIV